jgi:hypothetical protein
MQKHRHGYWPISMESHPILGKGRWPYPPSETSEANRFRHPADEFGMSNPGIPDIDNPQKRWYRDCRR